MEASAVLLADLSSWMEFGDYLKLSEAQKSHYTVIEFRLYIGDIVKQIVHTMSDTLRVKQSKELIDKLLNIVARYVLGLQLRARASLVLSITELQMNFSIPHQLSGHTFYCLPSWKLAFLTNKLHQFSYNYKVDNCMQSLQLTDCHELQQFAKSIGGIFLSQMNRQLLSMTLSELITKAAGKKSGSQSDSLSETESRQLNSDRRIRFDALFEPHINIVCDRGNIFWRIFAAHTVSLSLTDASTLISTTDACTFVNQSYTHLSKWLKSVHEGKTGANLYNSCIEFTSLVYRLMSCPAFAERITVTDAGRVLICRMSLRVQARLAPENKNFWRKEEAELLLTCFERSMIDRVGCDAFAFIDDCLSGLLSLCHCAKMLHDAGRLSDMLRQLGVMQRMGSRFSCAFTEAAKQIGLLRSLSEDQFVNIAALLFNECNDCDGLKAMVEDFLTTKDIDLMHEAFENSQVCSESLKHQISSYCSMQLSSKHLALLKSGEWKRFCDIWPSVRNLRHVSELWESEAIPAVRQALLASVTATKYVNDASPPNRTAFNELMTADGLMSPEFTVQLLTAIFASNVLWLVKLCLQLDVLLHSVQQADATSTATVQLVTSYIKLSRDLLHKCATDSVSSLMQGAGAEFRKLCVDCAAAVLQQSQLTRGVIEENVEKCRGDDELMQMMLQFCIDHLKEGIHCDAVLPHFISYTEGDGDIMDSCGEMYGLTVMLQLSQICSVQLHQQIKQQQLMHKPAAAAIAELLQPRNRQLWLWMLSSKLRSTGGKKFTQRLSSSRKLLTAELHHVLEFFESVAALSLTCQQFSSVIDVDTDASVTSRRLVELGAALMPKSTSFATQLELALNLRHRWLREVSAAADLLQLLRSAAAAVGLRLADADSLDAQLVDMRQLSLKATKQRPAPCQELLGVSKCDLSVTALRHTLESAVMRTALLLAHGESLVAREVQNPPAITCKQLTSELLQESMGNYTKSWLRLSQLPLRKAVALFADCVDSDDDDNKAKAKSESLLATQLLGCDCNPMLQHLLSLQQRSSCRHRLQQLREFLRNCASCCRLTNDSLNLVAEAEEACDDDDRCVGEVSLLLARCEKATSELDAGHWRCVAALAECSRATRRFLQNFSLDEELSLTTTSMPQLPTTGLAGCVRASASRLLRVHRQLRRRLQLAPLTLSQLADEIKEAVVDIGDCVDVGWDASSRSFVADVAEVNTASPLLSLLSPLPASCGGVAEVLDDSQIATEFSLVADRVARRRHLTVGQRRISDGQQLSLLRRDFHDGVVDGDEGTTRVVVDSDGSVDIVARVGADLADAQRLMDSVEQLVAHGHPSFRRARLSASSREHLQRLLVAADACLVEWRLVVAEAGVKRPIIQRAAGPGLAALIAFLLDEVDDVDAAWEAKPLLRFLGAKRRAAKVDVGEGGGKVMAADVLLRLRDGERLGVVERMLGAAFDCVQSG